MHDLTILDVDEVVQRMSQADLAFIKRMIQTSRSGTGFLNDIEHSVDNLATITRPVLVMYSSNDKTVSPKNARRVANEVATCELYPVPSDTHLIWIWQIWGCGLEQAVIVSPILMSPSLPNIRGRPNTACTRRCASLRQRVIRALGGSFPMSLEQGFPKTEHLC